MGAIASSHDVEMKYVTVGILRDSLVFDVHSNLGFFVCLLVCLFERQSDYLTAFRGCFCI